MQVQGPLIEHQTHKIFDQTKVKGKPFQILGFDFLIDENLKAWVLEINDHPSLNIYFSNAPPMSGTKYNEEDICPVDL